MTFCELREKDVINVRDCRRLGCVTDLIFDSKSGQILAIVVPGTDKFFSFFGKGCDCEIPWCKICQIGSDIILVDICLDSSN